MREYQGYVKDIKMSLPKEISLLVAMLENAGYEAFIVGGAVRDLILGRGEPYDYDITTNATPQQMQKVFAGLRVIPTGLKHGTITVIAYPFSVEVTTYRVDGEYVNHRAPTEVFFSSNLIEDLARRDFTMNALAYNDRIGVVDPFCGIVDMKKGLIRCVGDPNERFTEDALRIMRGLRFSSSLGFDIEQETKKAIISNFVLLSHISKERLQKELNGVLNGKNAYTVLTEFTEIFELVYRQVEVDNMPLTKPCFEIFSLFNKSNATAFSHFIACCKMLNFDFETLAEKVKLKLYLDAFAIGERLEKNKRNNIERDNSLVENSCENEETNKLVNCCENEEISKLVNSYENKETNKLVNSYENKETNKLVNSCENKEINKLAESPSYESERIDYIDNNGRADWQCEYIKMFRYDNKTAAFIKLADSAPKSIPTTLPNIRRFLNILGDGCGVFSLLYRFCYALYNRDEEEKSLLILALCTIEKVLCAKDECYKQNMLAVNGKDLKNLDIPTLLYGEYLNKLLYAVMDEKLENNKDELLKYLKNIIIS